MTRWPQLCVKTADNCNNGYCSQSSSTDVSFGRSKIMYFVHLKGAVRNERQNRYDGKERNGEYEYTTCLRKCNLLHVFLKRSDGIFVRISNPFY